MTATAARATQRQEPLAGRLDAVAWDAIGRDLDARGFAVIERLIALETCRDLISLYADDALFRKHVIMARHGYGRGEYKYFAYPLPVPVATLRSALYPHLAKTANRWNAELDIATRYPESLDGFLARCRKAGQSLPTPLLLKYGPGDFNCLHQDLYGEHAFPLQTTVLLEEPGKDFTGGEFVLTEQRPRMQSRVTVVPLRQGDAVIFAVHHRPVQSARGFSKVNVRHGVSELRSGHRYTLGVIFHDAK